MALLEEHTIPVDYSFHSIAYQNEVLQKGLDWNTLLLLPAESYLLTAFQALNGAS